MKKKNINPKSFTIRFTAKLKVFYYYTKHNIISSLPPKLIATSLKQTVFDSIYVCTFGF